MGTKVFLTLILLLLLASSCGSPTTPSFPQSSTPSASPPPIKASPYQVAPTPVKLTPGPAPSNNLVPTAALKSPVPTRTPHPILSIEEGKNLIMSLLDDSTQCQLPCLWGFLPGETTVGDVRAFVAQFGYGDRNEGEIELGAHDYGPYGGVSLTYPINDIRMVVHWGFTLDKNRSRIRWMDFLAYPLQYERLDPITNMPDWRPALADETFNQEIPDFVLPSILKTQGPPPEVRIHVDPGVPDRPDLTFTSFNLLLIYPEQGIYIVYTTPAGKAGENFISCPNQAEITMKVWDPEADISSEVFVEMVNDGALLQDWWNLTKPLSEATSLTNAQFYEVFSDLQDTSCLESPQSLWIWWED
jgi:hypothetical protein